MLTVIDKDGKTRVIEYALEVVEILNDSNYHASIYPAYCIRGMAIELLEEDKYFKVL